MQRTLLSVKLVIEGHRLDNRVMDPETNFDGVRNVGVKDGKMPGPDID